MIFGCFMFRISTPPKNQLAGLRNGTETRIFGCLLFRISTPPKNQLVDLRNGTETYDIRVFYVSNFNPSKKSIGRLAKWNRN